MFVPTFIKSEIMINYMLKINSTSKSNIFSFKLESNLEVKSIILENNQTYQNQFYTSRINFDSKNETKQTLKMS